jgi:magnesium transporter
MKLRSAPDKQKFTMDQIDLLDDVIIENQQASKQASIYSTVLSGLMDARGTIINNNMNVLLKNLTVINVVFLPLNLIASIGGMSEYSVMTKGIVWPIAYGAFSVAMIFLGWFTWWWLGKVIDRNQSRSVQKGD